MVGNNKSGVRHIMIHSVEELQFLSLDSDDLDFGVVVGRVELGRKSPLEAGQQSLFDVLQLHGRFIRGKDQLFACQLQVVEYVEEGVLGAGFSRVRNDAGGRFLLQLDDKPTLPARTGLGSSIRP